MPDGSRRRRCRCAAWQPRSQCRPERATDRTRCAAVTVPKSAARSPAGHPDPVDSRASGLALVQVDGRRLRFNAVIGNSAGGTVVAGHIYCAAAGHERAAARRAGERRVERAALLARGFAHDRRGHRRGDLRRSAGQVRQQLHRMTRRNERSAASSAGARERTRRCSSAAPRHPSDPNRRSSSPTATGRDAAPGR
jgi:hypothetical protein